MTSAWRGVDDPPHLAVDEPCVACETSEAPGQQRPLASDGSTAIGPIDSLIPQRPTIWRAIAVSCWMSDSAPAVIVP